LLLRKLINLLNQLYFRALNRRLHLLNFYFFFRIPDSYYCICCNIKFSNIDILFCYCRDFLKDFDYKFDFRQLFVYYNLFNFRFNIQYVVKHFRTIILTLDANQNLSDYNCTIYRFAKNHNRNMLKI